MALKNDRLYVWSDNVVIDGIPPQRKEFLRIKQNETDYNQLKVAYLILPGRFEIQDEGNSLTYFSSVRLLM